jgi:hypothetical protein
VNKAKARKTVFDRFMKKVSPEPMSGCWLWTGALEGKGYGCCWNGENITRAHRYSYEQNVGPIPDGLHVLHKCDVMSCVNPDHLFLGTNDDNVRDKIQKGRANSSRPGEKNPCSKLTADDVRFIRSERAAGKVYREIAARLNVSLGAVAKVASGRTWSHTE